MEIPKYFYFRVRAINKGTSIEVEDASDTDVVEVVRCKDCKWHEDNFCANFDVLGFGGDDYCSLGEKREDGKND